MNKKNGCSFDGGVSLNIINSGDKMLYNQAVGRRVCVHIKTCL